ncbi:hypothetical protein ACUZ8Y_22350 [Aeromonas veronii]
MAAAALDTGLPIQPAHQLLERITAPVLDGAGVEVANLAGQLCDPDAG